MNQTYLIPTIIPTDNEHLLDIYISSSIICNINSKLQSKNEIFQMQTHVARMKEARNGCRIWGGKPLGRPRRR
jgi:hypothetical protein